MPSPVRASVAAAASPANSTGPWARTARSRWAGLGPAGGVEEIAHQSRNRSVIRSRPRWSSRASQRPVAMTPRSAGAAACAGPR